MLQVSWTRQRKKLRDLETVSLEKERIGYNPLIENARGKVSWTKRETNEKVSMAVQEGSLLQSIERRTHLVQFDFETPRTMKPIRPYGERPSYQLLYL